MSEHKKNKLFFIYKCIFTALTILLAGLFIFKTVRIYQVGSSSNTLIFSQEIVKNAFFQILPALFCWIAALAGGIILIHKCPPSEKKKPKIPIHMTEERLAKKVSHKSKKVKNLHNKLMLLNCIFAFALIILSIFPIIYFLDQTRFSADSINCAVISAIAYTLPFFLLISALSLIYVILRDRFTKKLICAYKSEETETQSENNLSPDRSGTYTSVIRAVIICIAIILIIIGTVNGSVSEVFTKATKICTECIGLG